MSWIIHIFALLHAFVAFGCRMAGADDQLLLTVLTMALSLIICIKQGLKAEFTAAVVIFVNILGFLLGNLGADMLQHYISSEYAVHCLSTIITTEIIGWCILGTTSIVGQKEAQTEYRKASPYIKWILLVASGIFFLRLLIVVFLSQTVIEQDIIFNMIRRFMTNPFSTIIMICVNILFIRSLTTRQKNASKISTISLYIAFMVLATLLQTFLVGFKGQSLTLLLTTSMIIQITLFCIVYVINFAITTRMEMQAEREKANIAQYRYLKLKRQVNPHFLFNSLNVLDCLVSEEKTEQASTYIHKLAGIYRYMLKSEEDEVVSLRDELVFVNLYLDLQKERFPEGFDAIIDVPEESLARFVPPCSIQLLIENIMKHNAVSTDNPLTIKVKAEGDSIRVSNNIVPKITKAASTGLGQKYIRQLYLDLSGKSIDIEKTETEYCVTLPLL